MLDPYCRSRPARSPWRQDPGLGRSSDSRITLLAAPSHSDLPEQWLPAAFVPDYSGGTAPDSHGIPFLPLAGYPGCMSLSYFRGPEKVKTKVLAALDPLSVDGHWRRHKTELPPFQKGGRGGIRQTAHRKSPYVPLYKKGDLTASPCRPAVLYRG